MVIKKKSQKFKPIHLITGGAACVLLIAVLFAVKFIPSSDEGGRRKQIQTVTLVTPPPPPPPPKEIEKPPEPQKVQEKIETPKDMPLEKPQPVSQEPPPSANLGVDADAGVGGDAFGLQARRSGSNLIGGSQGGGSMYGWYAGQISNNLQKTANEIIQREGGIPPGKWEKVSFEVTVDMFGKISKFAILKSSGNQKIDDAVKKALQAANAFEPPPPGMPKVLKFAVSLQG
jgi:periplasmic protein TonB